MDYSVIYDESPAKITPVSSDGHTKKKSAIDINLTVQIFSISQHRHIQN